LEAKGETRAPGELLDDLPLFAAARPRSHAPVARKKSALEQEVDRLNPDELSPREALEALYRLKKL